MLKPRALQSGDRVAIVAPASSFPAEELQAGVSELRALGFDAVYTEAVLARDHYTAGPADMRAADLIRAWTDPSVRAVIAARGGYGSVHLLPLLDPAGFRERPKPFVGFSDNTTLLTWLRQSCGLVAFHGPMIEHRLSRGEGGYDRDTFLRCLCRPEPPGEISHDGLEVLAGGEVSGELVGGTLTLLTASLGTPYAFSPPRRCVLFLDEVAERPYKLDRMLTQMRLAGLLQNVGAIVFNELPRCGEAGEPGEHPAARETVRRVLEGFPGPILYGLRSGHTEGPTLTLPFGVRARVVAGSRPALVIEEGAVC